MEWGSDSQTGFESLFLLLLFSFRLMAIVLFDARTREMPAHRRCDALLHLSQVTMSHLPALRAAIALLARAAVVDTSAAVVPAAAA